MGLGTAWRGCFLCKEDFSGVRIPRAPQEDVGKARERHTHLSVVGLECPRIRIHGFESHSPHKFGGAMSRLKEKSKAAKRRSKDKAIAKTRTKVAKSIGFVPKGENVFSKFKPHACPKAKCFLCHGDKLLGKKTLKEKREEQKDKYDAGH